MMSGASCTRAATMVSASLLDLQHHIALFKVVWASIEKKSRRYACISIVGRYLKIRMKQMNNFLLAPISMDIYLNIDVTAGH